MTCKVRVGYTTRTPDQYRVDMASKLMSALTAEVPEKPYQPKDYNFPKRAFGKKGDTSRAFQSHWFKIWTFLHYDEAKDVVFCHTCMVAAKRKMLSTNNLDPAFVSCSINNNCYGLFNL